MNRYGFARVSVCSPDVVVGNPRKNVDAILEMLELDPIRDSDVVVFPELCITGYTCADLFNQRRLIEEAEEQIRRLMLSCQQRIQLVIVGAHPGRQRPL